MTWSFARFTGLTAHRKDGARSVKVVCRQGRARGCGVFGRLRIGLASPPGAGKWPTGVNAPDFPNTGAYPRKNAGHIPCYVFLKMTWVMIILGVWLLAGLVACLALCAAARIAMPSPDSRLARSSGVKADTIIINCGKAPANADSEYHLAEAA
jgi:hypothetical protein